MEINSMDELNITLAQWEEIYEFGGWEGEGSGPGSKLTHNLVLIDYLNDFIEQNSVSSLIDLGCGDLQWMPHVFASYLEYVGVDFCKNVLDKNKANHPNQNFIHANFKDLTESKELSFSKDVIHHDRDDMFKNFEKISELGSRYCMIVVPEYMKRRTTFETLVTAYDYVCVLDYVADETKSLYLKIK